MGIIDINVTSNQTVSYDQTKNTRAGRAANKTLSGKTVYGPALNQLCDTVTDSGFVPVVSVTTDSYRQFVLTNLAAGSGSVLLYNIDPVSLVPTYVGRINFQMPGAGAPTCRGFKVDDTNPANIRIFIGQTQTVANIIYGGPVLINKLTVSDFVPVGFPTITYATGTDQKAVYFLGASPSLIGATNPVQACLGISIKTSTSELIVHNGTAVSTHQFHRYNYSVVPDVLNQTVGSFTVASPGVVNITGHGRQASEAVVFTSTGTLPTGITAGTTYYVLSPLANSFNISATPGGAAINFTGAPSGVATCRSGFGGSTAFTYVATGNLTTLAGALTASVNNEDYCVPQDSSYGGLVGQDCVAFSTSTTVNMIKLSDLTGGATLIPIYSANINGQIGVHSVPGTAVPTSCSYSQFLDAFVFNLAGNRFIVKRLQNNNYLGVYGGNNYQYTVGIGAINPKLGGITFISADVKGGVLYAAYSNTVATNQAGIIISDISADEIYGQQYLITKVYNTPNMNFKSLKFDMGLASTGKDIKVYYRTSGFGTAAGGWLSLPDDRDMSSIGVYTQIQFKIVFKVSDNPWVIPAQLGNGYLLTKNFGESSPKWAYSHDNSTSGVPTSYVWELIEAYDVAVPTKLVNRVYDTTSPQKNLLFTLNSQDHIGQYSYSTDNGSSWIPLGTVPNVVGTLVKLTLTGPPGIKTIPSIGDE